MSDLFSRLYRRSEPTPPAPAPAAPVPPELSEVQRSRILLHNASNHIRELEVAVADAEARAAAAAALAERRLDERNQAYQALAPLRARVRELGTNVDRLNEQLRQERTLDPRAAGYWRGLYLQQVETNRLLDDRLARAENRPTQLADTGA